MVSAILFRPVSLGLSNARTYLFGAVFILGNLLLPQLCHFIPEGGKMLLPIYFFTLIGAYKFGIRVGLLTGYLLTSVKLSVIRNASCCRLARLVD